MKEKTIRVPARDLRPGDKLDMLSCPFLKSDPEAEFANAIVDGTVLSRGVVCVEFSNGSSVGYKPGTILTVERPEPRSAKQFADDFAQAARRSGSPIFQHWYERAAKHMAGCHEQGMHAAGAAILAIGNIPDESSGEPTCVTVLRAAFRRILDKPSVKLATL